MTNAPAALATADGALSESADTAAVAAAIAATDRADAVLHNVSQLSAISTCRNLGDLSVM